MSVRITDGIDAYAREEKKRQRSAMAEMAVDILTRATINAPKESGALVRSGRVNPVGTNQYSVSFGDNSVRYARRRHFENKKNPQTLKYLEKAGESVTRGNIGKYFR